MIFEIYSEIVRLPLNRKKEQLTKMRHKCVHKYHRNIEDLTEGQLISEGLFDVIFWTKKPTKIL